MTINQVNRYNSFEDVNNLEEAKINNLLENGDGPEKVWAIWSLALKKWKSSASKLQSLPDGEPSSGVRRNLIVVLAGMQQSDVLYSLAKHDPDASVRADALKYLIRISDPNDEPLSEFLYKRLINDSENIIKITILKEAPEELLTLSFNDIITFIEPSDPALQMVSLEQLDKRALLDDENAPAIAKLLLQAHDASILEKIMFILINGGRSELILDAGMLQEDKTNFDLLSYLAKQEIKFSWSSLQKFIGPECNHNSHMIIDFIQNPTEPGAFLWLSTRYAQMLELESWENDFFEIQKAFLETLSGIDKPDQMIPALNSNLQIIHKYMKVELHDMQCWAKDEWMYEFDNEEDYEEAILSNKANIEAIKNWLK
ncbi:hypothetical protein WH95_03210 [Kiloniella litopenaei]|uniref:HEAT repeat domain-containing protein n=1 Tax=Kiloniella litopenaei TaxID=1549748 RepID=A0A0M2RE86_9PROT|nr:HEAT repeat domain-containing protein [Kiloniella litopenaei]KKJ78325.1 hypothetical protein WH95_03210 [Kiloniella litopenaei]